MQLRKSLIAASISGALALGTAQSAHADLAYAFSLLSVNNLKVFLVPDEGSSSTSGQSINEVFTTVRTGFTFESFTDADIEGTAITDQDDDHDATGANNDVDQSCVTDGGTFSCPPENAFGPATADVFTPDIGEGAFARSDARFNSTGLGGAGVSFESVSEAQSFGTGRSRTNTSGSVMRWDFEFETPANGGLVEEGVNSNWALNIQYDALLTTFMRALGPGADTATASTTFTIQATPIGNASAETFTWPGSPVSGTEPFPSSTAPAPATPGDGPIYNCQHAGGSIPAPPPAAGCTSTASAFDFWSGDIFQADTIYNLSFQISTVATARTVSTEPSTLAVLGLGLFAAGAAARRRKSRAA
ncbi:MAG: EDSAP-1 family PEP-CTERM protein [Pseudomonadota bacterium]